MSTPTNQSLRSLDTGDTEVTPPRRPGELTLTEMLRWAWRQLTSMRTALILLLLLALAAIPGSVVPQSDVDSLKAANWQDAHPTLTPIYEKLGLFSVYSSPWFSAIYILLMVSLVGCFIPRTFVYWKAMRAGGLMLVAVGVLLVTGWWAEAVTWLQINLVSSTETVV